MTIDDIIERLRKRNIDEEKIAEVMKSYVIAKDVHKGQLRQSGEEYIIHPLHVASNLLDMEVYDTDTICAALLHDTIEDAPYDFTKEDIKELINETVAELVDGVTKMRAMNYSTKADCELANTRKIINGLNKDVRIILIKLCDRLHNMETLQYKTKEKQKENALETMELFVPLSLTIGAYRMKNKLEDLSLQYIEPDEFKKITDEKAKIEEIEHPILKEIAESIKSTLEEKYIASSIIYRTQTITSTYKRLKKGYKLENIYDLFYLKILVGEIEDCYRTLCFVHKNNPPINGRFKDYIYNPRTNLYQSLHTTVSNSKGKLLKVKIRTFDMDRVAAYGIPALWNIKNGKSMEETQKEVVKKCQFAKKLMELDESFKDNREFFKEIKKELLTEHIYVYTHSGDFIELPSGSTALDFACQVYPNLLDKMTGILVNGKEVPLNTVLESQDRIEVITKGEINHSNWIEFANTPTAKQKLKSLYGQK